MSKVWISGRLVDEDEACISPFDHALLTGDGVFETLRIYRGRGFALRRHLDRLARSAQRMDLDIPDPAVLREAVAEVIAANPGSGRLRITVTGGPSPMGPTRGPGPPTVIVATGPERDWPVTTDVVVVPWPRNERGALVGVKSVSYAENVLAFDYASRRGGGEAVFANLAGDLCEGTGSNVFVVIEGRLVTPPLSSGCLAGVTRDLVLECAEAVEEAVPVSALAGADEAFLTSSTRMVQAIRAVDGVPLASSPGPLTRAASEALSALVTRDLDP